MRKFLFLSFLPCLAWANDESLHSISFTYSQFSETLSFRDVEYELSPNSTSAAYTYISPKGWIWRADLWNEDANKALARGARIEKDAWGGGVSLAYPFADYEFELSYAYSRPKLNAWGQAGSRLEERNESQEYGIGVSSFFEHHQWSLIPSIHLAYQDSQSLDLIRINNTSLSTESNESGWLVSTALSLSYLHEYNNQTSISPFLGLSWTDFLEGKGLTRTRASRRNISLSTTEETSLDTEGYGLISAGIGLSFDRYHLDLSIDETIDLPSVGTQVNIGFGVVW